MGIPAGKTFVVDCPDVDDEAKKYRSDLTQCLSSVNDLEGNLTSAEMAVATAAAAASEAAVELEAASALPTRDYGTIIGVDSCGGTCAPVSGGTVGIMTVGDLIPGVPQLYECHFGAPDGTLVTLDGDVTAYTNGDHPQTGVTKYRIACPAPTFTLKETNTYGGDSGEWTMNVSASLPGQALEFLSDPEHYTITYATAPPAIGSITGHLEHMTEAKKDTKMHISIPITDEDSELSDVKVTATSSDSKLAKIIGVSGSGDERVLTIEFPEVEGEVTIAVTATDEHGRSSSTSWLLTIISKEFAPCKGRDNGQVTAKLDDGTSISVYCKDGFTQRTSSDSLSGNPQSHNANHGHFLILPCIMEGNNGRGNYHEGPEQGQCDRQYKDANVHPLWASGGKYKIDIVGPSSRTSEQGFQKWVAPFDADYEFTLWGARGGDDRQHSNAVPGKGGMVKALVKDVPKGTVFYFRIGQQGEDGNGSRRHSQCPSGDPSLNSGVYPRGGGRPWNYDGMTWNTGHCGGRWSACGGFNGGGPILSCGGNGGASGGGGTDVRLCGLGPENACKTIPDLDKRILVAGGGGGSSTEANRHYEPRHGGDGGDTTGQNNWERYAQHGQQSWAEGGHADRGGRSRGGSNGNRRDEARSHGATDGYRGQGGSGGTNDAAGGGGGYWGGAGPAYNAGGGGGSSCTECKPAVDSIKGLSIQKMASQRGANGKDFGYITIRIR